MFIAAILRVLIMFIIIYIIVGQSKLKTLVANIALQCMKAINALNTKNQDKQGCDLGMLKFLMTLNLAIVLLMILVKIKKSKIFQRHFFLQYGENKAILSRYRILCTIRAKQVGQKCPSV